MRSLDEIIKALSIPAVNGYHYIDSNDAIDALKYLEMYKELANDSALFAKWKENSPLTWNELKDMEGKPIWMERPEWKEWLLISEIDEDKCEIYLRDKWGNGIIVNGRNVGYWRAYRRRK